jgi:hypothetical protein
VFAGLVGSCPELSVVALSTLRLVPEPGTLLRLGPGVAGGSWRSPMSAGAWENSWLLSALPPPGQGLPQLSGPGGATSGRNLLKPVTCGGREPLDSVEPRERAGEVVSMIDQAPGSAGCPGSSAR